MKKYWDETLFPEVLELIRGERYLIMSDKQIADELIALAKRAVNNFLFPNVSLAYSYDAQPDSEVFPNRYYFINNDARGEVGDREFQIIVAWMCYFWSEQMASNADNFNNVYFDSNIKSFSPGNALHNYLKAMEHYRETARSLESRYYRVGEYGPSVGGTIDDD